MMITFNVYTKIITVPFPNQWLDIHHFYKASFPAVQRVNGQQGLMGKGVQKLNNDHTKNLFHTKGLLRVLSVTILDKLKLAHQRCSNTTEP